MREPQRPALYIRFNQLEASPDYLYVMSSLLSYITHLPGGDYMFLVNPILNNIDWSISGVEPLGRFFIYNMTIYKLKTNFLQGPDFDLILRFNCMSAEDAGFGKGWELSLTSVKDLGNELKNKVLCLADGRKFVIQVTADKRVSFINNDDPKQFILTPEEDGSFRISYKSGLTEIIGSDGHLSKIKTLFGNYITFEWSENRLQKIKDIKSEVISITYANKNDKALSEGKVTITYGSKETKFKFSQNGLSVISTDNITNESTTRFKFSYDISDNHFPKITSVTASGERKEKIKINYSASSLKNNNNPGQLAVSQVESVKKLINSSEQGGNSTADELIISYRDEIGGIFSPAKIKFIGNDKESDGLQVSEVIKDERKIVRQYNSSGQLFNEITLEPENDLSVKTDCRYLSFIYDSDSFSAPLVRKTSYEILNGKTYTGRSESYTYDKEYNLTEFIDDEGKKTTYVYFAPGDMLSDPDGIEVVTLNSDSVIKYLKSETVSYISRCIKAIPRSGKNLVKVKKYFYRYLISHSQKNKYIVLAITVEKTLKNDIKPPQDVETGVIGYHYLPSDDIFFGRIQETFERRGNESEAAQICKTFSYSIVQDDKVLETIEKKEILDFSKTAKGNNAFLIYNNRTGHYIDNGLVAWEIVPGEIIVYNYDYLNRLISKKIADIDHKDSINNIIASTDFDAAIVEKYKYTDFTVVIKNPQGLTTIKTYNYNAKLIDTKFCTKVTENPEEFFQVQTNKFDKLGKVVKESIWIVPLSRAPKKNAIPDVVTNYEYNVYGDICKKSTFRKIDTSEGEKLIVSDEEVFTNIIPFNVQRIDKNQLTSTTISQNSDVSGIKYVQTLITSLGPSKKVYKDETIFLDSMNRPALTKNALTRTLLAVEYDKYDHVIKEYFYEDKVGDPVIDEINYLYSYSESPYADKPSRIERPAAVISSTVFDAIGRQICKSVRGQNLISDYNDEAFPFKPTKTMVYEGEMAKDVNSVNEALKKAGIMCTFIEYDKKGNEVRKKYLKVGDNEAEATIFSYDYNVYGKIKKSELITRRKPADDATILYKHDLFGNIVREYSMKSKIDYIRMSDGSLKSAMIDHNNIRYLETYDYKGGLLTTVSIEVNNDQLDKLIDIKLIRNSESANKLLAIEYKINLPDKGEYYIMKNNFQYDDIGRLTGYSIVSGQFKYDIRWEFNADGHIAKTVSTGFDNAQDSYAEKYSYDYSGKITSWSGSGGTAIGRDEYDNKIKDVAFYYNFAKDLSKLKFFTVSEQEFFKNIYYDKNKRISLIQHSAVSSVKLPKKISYNYTKKYNAQASLDGSVSAIILDDGTANHIVQYISNGFSYAEMNRVILDVNVSQEKKTFHYDAQERIITTIDGGGFARVPGTVLTQKKMREFSRYMLDKLKITTFQYWSDGDKAYNTLARKHYVYLDDNIDCILNFDAKDRFTGVECFARLPDGKPVASIEISSQNGKVKTNGREYARGPLSGVFIVHDAELS